MFSRKRKFVEKQEVVEPISTVTIKGAAQYAPTNEAAVDVVWSIHNFPETVEYIREIASMDVSSDGKWYDRLLAYMEKERKRGTKMIPVKVMAAGKSVAKRIQNGTDLDTLRENDYGIEIVFTGFDDEPFACYTADLDYIPKQTG